MSSTGGVCCCRGWAWMLKYKIDEIPSAVHIEMQSGSPSAQVLSPAAGALVAAALAIAIPYAMHPRDWGDVISSSAVTISGHKADE